MLLTFIGSANFNSKMVRLKGGGLVTGIQSYIRFQFQNGTIKRIRGDSHFLRPNRFQFQNGTIKSVADNIIKVTIIIFQFQNGTIKSGNLYSPKIATSAHFNSKMVRLKDF